MANTRSVRTLFRFAMPLALAAAMLLPTAVSAQTTGAQSPGAQNAATPLPADAQQHLDQLQAALKSAIATKRWAEGAGKVTKVEALRSAQLDLLLGKTTPKAATAGRGVVAEEAIPTSTSGYAHPFYWAPFVLMGNWR